MKCTHAWHSRRKVIMGLVAQSPKCRLEEWRPKAGLTKTGVLELLIKVKSSQNFRTPGPQSQQTISAKSLTFTFGSCLLFVDISPSINTN